MRHGWWLLLLAGCATTGAPKREGADDAPGRARAEVEQVLARLPACQPGADVGRLVLEATVCTRMACSTPCCNRCGWAARYETMSGVREVAPEALRGLLDLRESPFECEIAAWSAALEHQSLALDAPTCVVR